MRIFIGIFIYCFLAITCIAAETSEQEVLEADYVVVGMGAAGAEIAYLLSQAGYTVIGIEAGGNHDNDKPIKDSTFAPILEEAFNPQYFYQLNQVVQVNASEVEFNYTTGRMLGGGTSINGEQYVEGTVELYAKWQQLLGDFWSLSEIHKAFINIENYNCATSCPDRGHQGQLDIRQAPVVATSMATKFVNAVTAATGFLEILDYNIPTTELGPFTRWQLTQKPNGNRESSSTAFLNNPNNCLKILTKTTALKILFDDKTAVGVLALNNGIQKEIYACKKVIISAGIYSPWLLQLSGIGPRDVLDNAGIKTFVDSPNVGRNLVNQFTSSAVFTADPNDVGVPVNDPSALYVGGAFLPNPTVPFLPVSQGLRGIELIGISPAAGTFIIAIIPLQPKSRGTVKIQSRDPLQIPLVDDMAFTNPDDMITFKAAFKIYIKSIAQQLNLIDPDYILINPPISVIDDDEALEEYILQNFNHTHHWTGTCQMANSIEEGVTDRFGNVFGVSNLVIADDSIAPFIPDGNTQACAYMIGRRIAKHIINTHQ